MDQVLAFNFLSLDIMYLIPVTMLVVVWPGKLVFNVFEGKIIVVIRPLCNPQNSPVEGKMRANVALFIWVSDSGGT